MKQLHERSAFANDDGKLATETFLMPCDATDAYIFERVGRGCYCLTLAAPGFESEDIEVAADGGFLRITGASMLTQRTSQVLHCGLESTLDRTFLLLRPLSVTGIEARHGLLTIFLQEQPGAGLQTVMPPHLYGADALALAA